MRLPLACLTALVLVLPGCIRPLDGPSGGQMDTPAMMDPGRNALGEVLEVTPAANGTFRFVVDADAVDCERNATRFEIEATLRENVTLPAVGERAPLVFHADHATEGAWWYGGVDLDPGQGPDEAFALMCSGRHDADMTLLPPALVERPGGTASQIFPATIRVGGETPLVFRVVNAADVPLTFRLVDVLLANEEAWYALAPIGGEPVPREDRARAARIEGCRASPANATFEVGGEDRHVFEVRIACDDDVDARPSYTTCEDQYARPGVPGEAGYSPTPGAACRETEAQRPYAILWAAYAFTDELGALHERGDAVMSLLHVARPATLEIEAPERASSRDEFVVLARYLDADRAPIRTAQMTIGLEYAGLENDRFGMTWDEAAGAYRFRWDDMAEHRPLTWREGAHRVTVDALDGTYEHAQLSAATVVDFQ